MVAIYSRTLIYWNLYFPSDRYLGVPPPFFSIVTKRLYVHVYVCV